MPGYKVSGTLISGFIYGFICPALALNTDDKEKKKYLLKKMKIWEMLLYITLILLVVFVVVLIAGNGKN